MPCLAARLARSAERGCGIGRLGAHPATRYPGAANMPFSELAGIIARGLLDAADSNASVVKRRSGAWLNLLAEFQLCPHSNQASTKRF